MAKILVIEDDKQLAKMVVDWLQNEKHTVDVVHDGKEGLDRLQFYSFDLAILDWELPSMNGPQILSEFRSKGGTIPIIMLTGKSELNDKVAGFDAGADDYLTKPFHPRELSVRLRALLMRPAQRVKDVLKAGDLELDSASHTVRKAGVQLHLMPREFSLLELFMRYPDEPFSTDAILNRIWSSESDVSTDLVKVYVAKLRRKIDDEKGDSKILTVHGVGYKLRT
jgi:two-component system OmpR family response regulator